MQLNQQQIQALCSQQLVQLVPQNYIPPALQQVRITDNPQVAQYVPLLAVLTIQRTQANAQQRPSAFSLATLNILGNKNYNSTEFVAVIRALAQGLPIFANTQGAQFGNNVEAMLMAYCEAYVKGAVALMYTHHQLITQFFDQMTNQAIVQEAQRMSQLLNGGGTGLGGGSIASLLGGTNNGQQQQQQGNQLAAFGTMKPAGNGGGLFNNDIGPGVVPTTNESIVRKESFFARQLKEMREGVANEQVQLSDAVVVVSSATINQAPAAAAVEEVQRINKGTTLIMGDPDGMVIQSTRSDLNIDQAIIDESTQVWRSNGPDQIINRSTLRKDGAEDAVVWDLDTPMSSQEFHSTVAIDPKDTVVANAENPPIAMSGLPGISKSGDLVMRGYQTDMKAIVGLLTQSGYYTAAEVKAEGLRWYPCLAIPTLPACDTKTQELRFYPILADDGLFAHAFKRDDPSENMEYERHGVGFIPANLPKVEEVETKQKPTTLPTPKPYKIKVSYFDTLDMDTSFAGAYNQAALSFLTVVKDEEGSRDVVVQPVMQYSTFTFETEDLIVATKDILTAIGAAETFNDVLEQLDKLEAPEQIPVRELLSRLFGVQLSRALSLRIGVAVEIEGFDSAGWLFIQDYINEQFPDPFVRLFYAEEKNIIREVMNGHTAIVSDVFTLGLIESICGTLPEGSPNVLVFGSVEQVMFVPHIAAELEFTDHTENFLIPESSVKLHAMAKDLLERKTIKVSYHGDGEGSAQEVLPAASVIITKDGYRAEVTTSLLSPTSIVGRVRKI